MDVLLDKPFRFAGYRLVFLVALACFVLLASGSPAVAQIVDGRVVDASDGRPLPDVSVVLRATSTGVATNDRGAFQLKLPSPGTHVLTLRHLGFETATRTVQVRVGERVRLDVELEPAVIGGDEVVVRARAVRVEDEARSVERLDEAALRASRGQTFGDALTRLPGVTTLSTGASIDKPVVRGLHSDRVVLVNRGVRQEGQQWGREHAPEVDPFAPVEVSVVKGAAGVEYGAGAIGGVLRLEPRALPESSSVHARLDLDAFSNNGQGAGALHLEGARSGAGGTLSWRTHGSLRKAGASRTPDYIVGNSGFNERNLSLATQYTRGDWSLLATASRFDSEIGIFSGSHVNTVEAWERVIARSRPAIDYSFSYDIEAPKQEVVHDLATLRANGTVGNGYRVVAQYGIQRNQRREFDAHSPGGGPPSAPGVELTLITHTTDVSLRSPSRALLGGQMQWSTGISAMNQGNENGRASYLIPNYRAVTGGAFGRTTWMRGNWTLDAGVRLDRQWSRSFPRDGATTGFLNRTQSFWGGSGVVSATWEFADTWSLGAAASTAWRPPGFNELYSDGVHHGSAQYETGNPDLRPERAWATDWTLRHDGNSTRLHLGVYETRIADFINLTPSREPVVTIRGVFPRFVYQQQDAVLRGIDGSAEVDVASPLTLGATASVVRGTDQETSLPLVDMPPDQGSVFAHINLVDEPTARVLRALGVRVEGRGVREQTRVPPGVEIAPPPPGYALLNLRLETEWSWNGTPFSLQAGVDNTFDTRYRDYLDRMRFFTDALGRTFTLRFHISV